MTTRQIFLWIHTNLRPTIDQAIATRPGVVYTSDQLVGITYRETGGLINRYASAGTAPAVMHALMRGDYTRRPGEREERYHGYGYTQIDVASFPDFIASGAWKDPFKTYIKSIDVLESKRKYIVSQLPGLKGEALERAVTAAYNCGEGNVVKVLQAGKDVDSRTADHNYSKDVWARRQFYRDLLAELSHQNS